ncbi:MAG: nickel pincer cofactor biosynthesis protein LarC [Methanobacteriaceae archaeon]|nr:nickel pincer cofactor biosynthesis protein LarC [Methanobacteriaceae archaeon]
MVVIIDPQQAGISGNMVIGALINLGANSENIKNIMEHYGSHFGEVNVEIRQVNKSGILASFVDVKCFDHHTISYKSLVETLDGIKHEKITPGILEFSKEVFKTLAMAESQVHGVSLDEIHFHEVGAADAVADIIGSAYAFHELELHREKVYGLPPALGGGRIKTQHGNLTVPAPATLEILKNVPALGGPVNYELTTPTGAALLVNMVDEFCEFYPLITNQKVAYGAGKLNLDFPNVLRIVSGTSPIPTDRISILETNLDDVTGEVLGNTMDRLMEEGALDVTIIPTIAKKNRPGHLLRVITRSDLNNILTETIIRETGTLGVRTIPYVHRNIVNREIIPVEIEIKGVPQKVHLKVAMIGDEMVNFTVEYEDAKKISRKMGIPLKDVIRIINQKANVGKD